MKKLIIVIAAAVLSSFVITSVKMNGNYKPTAANSFYLDTSKPAKHHHHSGDTTINPMMDTTGKTHSIDSMH